MLPPTTLLLPATSTSIPNLPQQRIKRTIRSSLRGPSLHRCRIIPTPRRGMRRQRARPMPHHLRRQDPRHLPHRRGMRLSRHITRPHMRALGRPLCRRGMRPSQGTTASPMAATVLPQCPRRRHSNNRLPPLLRMARRRWHRARHRQHNHHTALYHPVRAMRRDPHLRAPLPTTTSSSTLPPQDTHSSTIRPTLTMGRVLHRARHMRTQRGTHTPRPPARRLIQVTRRYPSAPTTRHPIQTRL
jgi:hypothetical protein